MGCLTMAAQPELKLLAGAISDTGKNRMVGWSIAIFVALALVSFWIRDGVVTLTKLPSLLVGVPAALTLLVSVFGLRSANRDAEHPEEHPLFRAVVDGRVQRVERVVGPDPSLSVVTDSGPQTLHLNKRARDRLFVWLARRFRHDVKKT